MNSEPDQRLSGARAVVVNWRDPQHHLAGGSERYAWELSRGLLAAGATVDFLTSRDRGQTKHQVVDGIRIRRAGGRFTVYAWTLLLLWWWRRRVDFVVDIENGIASFAPVVLGRSTPVVLVMHHVHLDQFRTHFPAPMAAVGRFLEGRAIPQVYRHRAVIAVSESTASEMRSRLGWRGPIEVVHNGTDMLPAAHRPEPGRIAVLGRLVAHKHVERVIEAVAALSERHVRLDIIGRGPDSDRLRRLIDQRGVGDRVTLHGFVDAATKADLLARACVHVCASEGEGWGQVVLEAAGAGVPTLAFDVAGLRDSIRPGVTGWLLPYDADLSTGLRAALAEVADPQRSRELEQACQDWAQRFTWPAMRERVVGVIATAVQR